MKITSNNLIVKKILQLVQTKYHAKVDYPWYKYPDYFVIRAKNKKWFGIIMQIPYQKLHLNKEGIVNILNVKIADQGLYDMVVNHKTIFPGYHMAKHKWVSILLDKSVKMSEIAKLIAESYITITKK